MGLVLGTLAELLFQTVALAIALGEDTPAGIANRVGRQRGAAAIRASTHASVLGPRRITIALANLVGRDISKRGHFTDLTR